MIPQNGETDVDGSRPGENGAPRKIAEIFHDAWGRLVLIDGDGVKFINVQPVRSFPISAPEHGIAICDSTGRELLWIENLEELPALIRDALNEHFSRREFVPVIQRIIRVSSSTEPSEWEVETDRGQTRFVLKHGDDVRRLDHRRAMIIDAHGVRYLVPDSQTLDAATRRILERYF
jgi:hypothetical protein